MESDYHTGENSGLISIETTSEMKVKTEMVDEGETRLISGRITLTARQPDFREKVKKKTWIKVDFFFLDKCTPQSTFSAVTAALRRIMS